MTLIAPPFRAALPFLALPWQPSATIVAGWSSPVARQAHNLKVVSSNLAPATNFINKNINKPRPSRGLFRFRARPAAICRQGGLLFAVTFGLARLQAAAFAESGR
jgi:hypothetical protein